MRRSLPALVALSTLLGLTASADEHPTSPATLRLSALPDEDGLAALLWERSPDFAPTRARLAEARAELQRAHLLPNPELDVSMNTIPVGATNPPGLRRLDDVPNYVVGLSERVELGKRGPRQDSARASLQATALDARAALRERTYDVLERAADVATTEVRIAELEKLTQDARKLTDLQLARQQHGDAAGLDVDRSTLEAQALETSLGEEQARLADALRECAKLAGLSCEPFGGRDRAAAFLQARLDRTPAPRAIPERPDLRALSAQQDAAKASLTLARRRWIPDPTVRAGYTRDQFVIAGNQKNSLFVGLSIPLPVFDHGQADAHAASASAESARVACEQLTAQAERDADTLGQQLRAVQERRDRLHAQTLPLAQGVVQRLDAAVKAGGAALQDLLLARRTYGELVLHAADLDQTAWRLSLAIDRASAAGPGLRTRWPVPSPEPSPETPPPRTSTGRTDQTPITESPPMTTPDTSSTVSSTTPSRRAPVWMAFAGAGLLGTGVLLYVLAPTTSVAEDTPAASGPTVQGEAVNLPEGAPQWHYVQLAVATEGSALTPLPSPARVQFDEARTASVGAPLAGRVEEVRVRPGDRVKQGDDLFSVRSAAFAELLREQRGAQTDLAEKRRNTERLAELVALRAAPEKDLLAARTELRQAELSLEAATAKQASLRVSSRGDNLYWVKAPRTGTVVDLDVVASQEVTPDRDKPLVRLSDLDEVLVVADLQEADALDMSPGQDVTVATRDGLTRAGRVDRVSEVVDPLRRTVEVRVRVPNTDRRLRPNAFVEVTPSPPSDVKRVRVPDSAVVTDGARSVVFVARDANRLERVAVTPGRRRDGEVELRGGLSSGDRFVARGALLLENQIELAD